MSTNESTKQPAPMKRGRGRPPRDPNAPKSAPEPKRSRAKPASDVGRASFTIEEFLHRNGLGDGSYDLLKKAGCAPREMRPTAKSHGIVRISREAELEWIAKSEERFVSEEEKATDRGKRAAVSAARKTGAR